MTIPSDARRSGPAILALAAPATLGLLLLLFVESTRFSGPFRRGITGDPVTYHQALGLLALLLPVVLAWVARRSSTGEPRGATIRRLLPGAGPRLRVAYAGLLAAYAVAVLVSSAGSQAPEAGTAWYALRVLMVPAEILAFGFLAPALLRRADAELIVRLIVWLLAAFAALSLAWMLTGRDTFAGLLLSVPPDDRGGRWASSEFFVHRNTIGGFLALAIPAGAWLAWTRARRGERRGAATMAGLVALLLLWLVLCFSRSSELALVVTIGVAALLLAWTGRPGSARLATAQRWLRRVTVAGLVVAVIAAVVVVGLLPAIRPGLTEAVVGALHGRWMIWQDVWDKTSGHRWLGAGFLGVEAVGPGGYYYGEVYDPHNAWLAQLVYFGVPGLAALAMLVVTMLADGFRRYRREVRIAPQQALLVAGIAGILVQNVFEYFLTDPVLFSNAFALLLLGWWRTGLWEDEPAAA